MMEHVKAQSSEAVLEVLQVLEAEPSAGVQQAEPLFAGVHRMVDLLEAQPSPQVEFMDALEAAPPMQVELRAA